MKTEQPKQFSVFFFFFLCVNIFTENQTFSFITRDSFEPVMNLIQMVVALKLHPIHNSYRTACQILLISVCLDSYWSPVYYCPERSGARETESSVFALDLKCGPRHPDHWIKRATAVLLNLGN